MKNQIPNYYQSLPSNFRFILHEGKQSVFIGNECTPEALIVYAKITQRKSAKPHLDRSNETFCIILNSIPTVTSKFIEHNMTKGQLFNPHLEVVHLGTKRHVLTKSQLKEIMFHSRR